MTSVTGFTSERSQAIEDMAIIGGSIIGDDLILVRNNGDTVNAGNVRGPAGTAGSDGTDGDPGSSGNGLLICTSSTRPPFPFEGEQIWETDTNRVYIWNGTAWRWRWSSNGEDRFQLSVNVAADDDAIAASTWPAGLEVSIDVPPWAKYIEGFALLGQAKQVTAVSNTSINILLGSGVIDTKRIRWAVRDSTEENDIVLSGLYNCSAMAGSTQLFRVVASRVSGTGALRLDSESVCYLKGEFKDV